MILYHVTNDKSAESILTSGFRDNTGTYMTGEEHTGVWVSNIPLDENEGAAGGIVLKITSALSEVDIGGFEWIEEDKPYREWLVPAQLLNSTSQVSQLGPDEEAEAAE